MAGLWNALSALNKRILDSIQYSKAKIIAIGLRLKILEEDRRSRTLLLSINPDTELQFTLTIDHGLIGHRLESSVIFSKRLLTLKTISDLGDICFAHKVALSGIDSTPDGKIRLNVCHYLGNKLGVGTFYNAAGYIAQCMSRVVQYMYDRNDKIDTDKLDLSMFDEIDLFMFNPQKLGEEKEFVYGTWKNYMRVLSIRKEDSPGTAMFDPPIEDLIACESFESCNELSMAEIGDQILEEILWNRRFSEISAEEDYSVN